MLKSSNSNSFNDLAIEKVKEMLLLMKEENSKIWVLTDEELYLILLGLKQLR